jgi:hypothetical protein
MSSKSVKFEISLKELKVTFEGDIQTAERMQGQITGAINSLASAQNRMLSPATQTPSASPVLPAAAGTRRRRRRSTAAPAGGIDPAILDGAVVPENGDGAGTNGDHGADATTRRARRTPGGNQTGLISDLKNEGFFGAKRSIGDIRGELARKGHTFQSNEISPTLTKLTKERVLKRDKDEQSSQWVYHAE